MNNFKQYRNVRRQERGIALLLAVVALVLIGLITAGMITLSTTETSISANFRDEQVAFFSAKAGIEEVRDRFRPSATNTLNNGVNLPTTLPGNAGSILYITNPANGETIAPWNSSNSDGNSTTKYADDEICSETTSITCSTVGGRNLASLASCGTWCASGSASSEYWGSATKNIYSWKWVRINLKQNNSFTAYSTNGKSTDNSYVCWNGTYEYASSTACVNPNLPVYVLTSLAVTPNGSRRMVQVEIAEDRLNFTAPGPLTLDGPAPAFSNPSSNNFGISGNDTAGCGQAANPLNNKPAIVVPNAGDVPTIKNDISGQNPNRSSHYTGVDGTTPDVNSSPMPTNLSSVSSLNTLISTIKNSVTEPVITGPATDANISNFGSAGSPQIIYVNGDLALSPASSKTGYGILVVTGNLVANGNMGWNGLVLVVGKGSFTQNGGGNGSWNGAVVVANTTGAGGTLAAPTFNFGGGGDSGMNYSSGCITNASNIGTFHVNAIRELMN